MTTKIVVGVDGSAPSRAAVTWAVRRAARLDGSVLLVYVSDTSPFSQEPAFLDEAIAAAEDLLQREQEFAHSVDPAVAVTTKAVPGVPIRELSRIASDADLLVVGTHKGSHLREVVAGSRGIKLAAVSPAPVAVVPLVEKQGRKGIVVGIDREKPSEAALEAAVGEAASLGEPLTLVYAWALPVAPSVEYAWSAEVVQQIQADAEAFVAESVAAVREAHPGIEVSGWAVQGSPVAALVQKAETASVLVVGNRGLRGFARLLLGSVSHGVLNNIPSPVIVVRAVPVPADSLDLTA